MESSLVLKMTDFISDLSGETDCTQIIQAKIEECGKAGRGTLLFPAGTYVCGSIRLVSHLRIILEPGAVLKASPDPALWKKALCRHRSRMDIHPWKYFIFGEDLEDIILEGNGTFWGGGEYPLFQDNIDNSPERPYGLFLVHCKDITVRGLTMRNSGFWMQRYLYCNNVRLENLNIWNHSNRNNDGIDIDCCSDVRISHCIVDSSDDGICLKSEGETPCNNVTVTGCTVATHACAFKLGTGSVGGFNNIVITNCTVRPSLATQMHHPLKGWGGLAAVDLSSVDGGTLENVVISNLAIDGVETPIFIRLGKRLSTHGDWMGYGGQTQDAVMHSDREVRLQGEGAIDRILLSGIMVKNAGPIPCIISGYEDRLIGCVTLRDLVIECSKSGNEEDLTAFEQWSPECYPCNRTPAYEHNLSVYGLYCRYIKNLFLSNVRIEKAKGEVRNAFKFFCVENAVIRDVFPSPD